MNRALSLLPAALLVVVGTACLSKPFDPPPTREPTAPVGRPPETALELALLLPDVIADQPARKRAYEGEQLLSGQTELTASDGLLAFIERVGTQPESILFAHAVVLSREGVTAVTAYRLAGETEEVLSAEYQLAMDTPEAAVEWSELSVGGKEVLTAADPDNPGNLMYLYTTGDLIFLVTAANPEVAVGVLEALPPSDADPADSS
ncbi:MAG: hypothetical protein LC744_03265 [Chloroflexi bacterium]|nr:hypothetical protein [Chloroflexota bacterium]